MRLTAQDLRDMNILKYYRLTRKWACKTYGLTDADLELLIYLDHKGTELVLSTLFIRRRLNAHS
jgi:hypothetical protein